MQELEFKTNGKRPKKKKDEKDKRGNMEQNRTCRENQKKQERQSVKNEAKKERRSADNEHTFKGLLELETPGNFFLLSLWDMKLK